ncbi:RNA polymerase I-specific transcription initiation factor RRN3 [Hanseniaspora valbyensis NRRL Y-1626]|uniref:RNA polymerase I-specific transcription initiation factor RRN3 n=1 Tax=Hanseniaspora valbyensis NRRL Y-1626 TaxID=766949 RepID=A0A1B7TJA4_9ASCO|nr:RNA polymerase I-specific transcription initiation factor RRN3 [Hanseniaspora valbyensis NRRL Y-1626]
MLTSKLKRSALDAELSINGFEDIKNSPKRSRSDTGYEIGTSSDDDISTNKFNSGNRVQVTSPLATITNIVSISRSTSPPPKLSLMQSNNNNNNSQEFKKFYNNFIEESLDLALEEKKFENLDNILSSLQSQKISNINTLHVSILLKNLSKRITKLEKCTEFKPVIENLILLNGWYTVEEHYFSQNYIIFIKLLCSGSPKYISKVMETFVVQLSESPLTITKNKHHLLFQYLVNGFPTVVNSFLNLLIKCFPNKNDTQERNVNYLENVLEIMKYCKESRYSIMALLIEKMISIDVELQNEIDEIDSDSDDEDSDNESSQVEEEEEYDDEFSDSEEVSVYEKSDSDSEEGSAESNSENEEEEEGEDGELYLSDVIDKKIKNIDGEEVEAMEGDEEYDVDESNNIKELSLKLDFMLTKMSEFFKESLKDQNLESDEGIELFTNLKSIFKSHILPTYYTKSTQYLIFHASQEQPELMDSFLFTLLDIAFSKVESIESRVKALQFISSFIARAKNLTKPQILFVTTYLVTWLNRYVVERESEIDDMPGSMERFEHLYAAFQALCYIFCFRYDLFKLKVTRKNHQDKKMTLEEELSSKISGKNINNSDSEWECDLDKFFQRIILSKFNPLKYCNENVILMFASIAQKVNLVYCYTVIERNNKDNILGVINSNDTIASATLNNASSGESGYDAAGLSSTTSLSGNATLSVSNTTSLQKKQFIDLQSYFPFDPLFLPTYKEFMKECYIEWKDVSSKYDEQEEV